MTGDVQDMVARLKAVLPQRWFGDTTPVLDAVVTGLATAWAWLYDFYGYAKLQTRIATATDTWLDRISADFFGSRLLRRANESDSAFRIRIMLELRRPRATRPALIAAITDLTGRAPVVFEPARPADTGAYNVATGYDTAGAWGSLALPCQVFVTAFRPAGQGIAAIPGWDFGGWSESCSVYASLDMITGRVTDADIFATIADVLPASVIAWARITN
jgi:hypothetical protein